MTSTKLQQVYITDKFSSLSIRLCFSCFYAMLAVKVSIVTKCDLFVRIDNVRETPSLHATTTCCYYLEKCYSRVCNVITLTQLRAHRYDLLLVLGKMDYLSTDSINAIPTHCANDRTSLSMIFTFGLKHQKDRTSKDRTSLVDARNIKILIKLIKRDSSNVNILAVSNVTKKKNKKKKYIILFKNRR